ncbi:MAG: hypothetical protein PHX83_15545 [Acidobacteriia bacterium]|nr:hypothetical protein [Terriglobia bacterium]
MLSIKMNVHLFPGSSTRTLLIGAALLSLSLCTQSINAESYTLTVKHLHVHGSSRGHLYIDDRGIRYETFRAPEQLKWTFKDLQEIQFLSEKRLALVSYLDSRWRLGGDRIYKFELTDGTIPQGLVRLVESHFPKPVSNRLAPPVSQTRYEIPAKHLHRTGGCQGNLVIAENGITFISSQANDSRFWRYDDLEGIGTSGPYDLRLGAYEHGPFQYGGIKQFRFQLKTKLREEAYRFIWQHLNSPDRDSAKQNSGLVWKDQTASTANPDNSSH